MLEFFNVFSINLLLRSIFAGLLFEMAQRGSFVGSRDGNGFPIDGNVITRALLIGVLIYVIYRSMVYPFFEWFQNSEVGLAIFINIQILSPNALGRRMEGQRTRSAQPSNN